MCVAKVRNNFVCQANDACTALLKLDWHVDQSGESHRSFLSGHSSETNLPEMCPFLPYSRNENRQSDPHQLKVRCWDLVWLIMLSLGCPLRYRVRSMTTTQTYTILLLLFQYSFCKKLKQIWTSLSRWRVQALIDSQEGMKVNMKNFQGKLDKETRSAIKAAMGLERCVVNILGRTMTGDTAHEDLFNHLSSLKSNLWQMLVMSMADEVVWISNAFLVWSNLFNFHLWQRLKPWYFEFSYIQQYLSLLLSLETANETSVSISWEFCLIFQITFLRLACTSSRRLLLMNN